MSLAIVAGAVLLVFWQLLKARMAASDMRSTSTRRATAAFQPAGAGAGVVASAVAVAEPRTAADLGQLLLAMPAACRSMLQGRGIVLEHCLPPHPLAVFVQREEIEQLLMHVARIACRALKDGGTLQVLALADGARAAVHFMDVGPDASGLGLAHLFERGARESDAGVLHCQRIAGAHNGRIYAAPSALGALGITFRLPLCAPAPAAEGLR
ncbi:hypothetical protein ACSFA8_18930 [Variovorax sp. RT4R15]|uniref:hypothetical protein n=1 Tax=Variovorax sp. RT4R15 TaxID=3443737 RepID=UPI003F46A70E